MKSKEIEDFAKNVVQSKGLGELSFRNIAQAVGVKSSSVHYHFPTKSDLLLALLRNYTDSFQLALLETEQTTEGTLPRLLAFARLFEDVLANDQMCLCGVMAASVNELDQACREALDDFFCKALSWLTRILKDQAPRYTDLSSEELASLILCGLEGAVLLDRVNGKRTHFQSQLAFFRSLF